MAGVDLGSALGVVGGLVGGGGLWAFLGERAKAQANAPAAMAASLVAFQGALNGQSQQLIAELSAEMAKMRTRIEQIEAESARCENENRQLRQRIDSLENMLRRSGIDIPRTAIPGSFIVMEGDRTTVMSPSPAHFEKGTPS